jgi:UDP-N-acetylglucosamine---dolichyl-phosphate N-acetylglucosaminyltransferase
MSDKKLNITKIKDATTIVMPAFNEAKVIEEVIKGIKKEGYKNIILVDDGSNDNTSQIALKNNVYTITMPINRGVGATTKTGIDYALTTNAKIIVTFDSDGQHYPKDIIKVIMPIIKNKADVVVGTRLKNPKGMPIIRIIGNWGFNIITLILFGVWTTDSQSGFKAFNKKAAKKIEIKTNRMEFCSEIIKEIGDKKLRLKEVPIKVIYTDYSRAHGQSTFNAFRILAKLILRRLIK